MRLEFKASEVLNLIKIVKTGKVHSVTLSMLFEAKYHKGNKVKKIKGWPDHKNIDHSKVPPHLQLVKDQGVYLMASSHRPDIDPVFYAKGMNPDTDADWYETAYGGLGGDDFSEAIMLNDFEKQLESAKLFIVKMNAKSYTVSVK